MKNPIDNPINEVINEAKLYKIISTFAGILIIALCIIVKSLLSDIDLYKGTIENLESANQSKNYMLNDSL